MAIVKILSRTEPTYQSLINYIIKGSNEPLILKNIRSHEKKGQILAFIENETFRKSNRKNQVYMYHEIVSFSDQESTVMLTPVILRKLGEHYVKLRGEDNLLIGAIHRDKNHIHIHFAVSGLKYRTGKSARLSKSELLRLKQEFQKFHNQELGITKSNPEHGKNRLYLNDKERYTIFKNFRNRDIANLNEIIKICLSKARSKREFFDMLMDHDLAYYERKGVPVGLIKGEKKYRFSNLDLDKTKFERLKENKEEFEGMLKEIERLRERRGSKQEFER